MPYQVSINIFVFDLGSTMTMNCPFCGSIMIWLNGSICHDPPTKFYTCRACNISITKHPDGTEEVKQQQTSS
jgi:hypothetical protein